MSERPWFAAWLLCGLTVAALSAHGQEVVNVEEANVTGTLTRVGPLGATIATPLGPYEVDLVNREFQDLGPARIEVKGERPPEFLKPGMTVRFQAEVVNKRSIRGTVSEVAVVDPATVAMRGAVDAEAGEIQTIVGRLRTFRRGLMSIEVPGERRPVVMQAKLDKDAVVRISLSSIAAAKVGDRMQVKGWKEIGGRLKRIWAQEVTVTSRDKPDGVAARANPPADRRRAFGDVDAAEEPPEKKSGDVKGVILRIN